MPPIVVDLSNFEAAIDQLLALQQEGALVQLVDLTLPSDIVGGTIIQHNIMFFALLGSFPLLGLRIDFSPAGGQVLFPCEWLATTIQATRPTLTHLILRSLEMTGDAEGLIRALQDHPGLTQMSLFNFDTGGNLTHESLIYSLVTCRRLQVVEYDVCEQQEGLGPALSSLCMHPSVKKLRLTGPKLKDYMPSLCQILSTNTTLQCLDLRLRGLLNQPNQLELEPTFDSIGKMVEKNTTMKTLTLGVDASALSILDPTITALSSHNRSILRLELLASPLPGNDCVIWPESTLQALKEMLKENTALLRFGLFVWNNRPRTYLRVNPPEHKDEISFYLKLNRLGRQHLLLKENPTKELADVIISNHDDTSVVFYLLSLNLSLLQVQSLAVDDLCYTDQTIMPGLFQGSFGGSTAHVSFNNRNQSKYLDIRLMHSQQEECVASLTPERQEADLLPGTYCFTLKDRPTQALFDPDGGDRQEAPLFGISRPDPFRFEIRQDTTKIEIPPNLVSAERPLLITTARPPQPVPTQSGAASIHTVQPANPTDSSLEPTTPKPDIATETGRKMCGADGANGVIGDGNFGDDDANVGGGSTPRIDTNGNVATSARSESAVSVANAPQPARKATTVSTGFHATSAGANAPLLHTDHEQTESPCNAEDQREEGWSSKDHKHPPSEPSSHVNLLRDEGRRGHVVRDEDSSADKVQGPKDYQFQRKSNAAPPKGDPVANNMSSLSRENTHCNWKEEEQEALSLPPSKKGKDGRFNWLCLPPTKSFCASWASTNNDSVANNTSSLAKEDSNLYSKEGQEEVLALPNFERSSDAASSPTQEKTKEASRNQTGLTGPWSEPTDSKMSTAELQKATIDLSFTLDNDVEIEDDSKAETTGNPRNEKSAVVKPLEDGVSVQPRHSRQHPFISAATPTNTSTSTTSNSIDPLVPNSPITSTISTKVRATSADYGAVPPTKPDPTKVLQEEIWMQILAFVGPGYFAYVAGVNRPLKEWYNKSCALNEKPREIFSYILSGNVREGKRLATSLDTFYCAAFSSVTCAEYWYEDTMGNNGRSVSDDVVCEIIAFRGKWEVLQWAHAKKFPWDEFTCHSAAWGGHLDTLTFLHQNNCPWHELTCEGAAAAGDLECLKYGHQKGCPWTSATCAAAAYYGHMKCLKYAHEEGCEWDEWACQRAAESGHLECLRYLHDHGCPWNKSTCEAAARYGHFAILQYAHDNGCQWTAHTCAAAAYFGHLEVLRYAHDNDCPWSEWTCTAAAEMGQLECLRYLHDHGCPWNETTCEAAARYGHFTILQYAHDNGCPCNEWTCFEAAKGGHLDILKWAHDNHCPWNEEACKVAAERGHLECLKYLHDHGCPWDEATCETAAYYGHLEVLKYAHDNGCPWDERTCFEAAKVGNLEIFKWLHENCCPWDEWTCSAAANGGHLEILKFVHENHCPWDEWTCFEAAKGGHLDILKWAHENHCPWHEEACKAAAEWGHLECLKYLHDHGCPWNEAICAVAAQYGHLEVLEYAQENDCPWNEEACTVAAEWGHLECLKYLHGHGCPWNESICEIAAQYGHLECLQYAHEKGCEWNSMTCYSAALGGHLECLKYARANGCPWHPVTYAVARDNGHDEVVEWLKNNGCPLDWY